MILAIAGVEGKGNRMAHTPRRTIPENTTLDMRGNCAYVNRVTQWRDDMTLAEIESRIASLDVTISAAEAERASLSEKRDAMVLAQFAEQYGIRAGDIVTHKTLGRCEVAKVRAYGGEITLDVFPALKSGAFAKHSKRIFGRNFPDTITAIERATEDKLATIKATEERLAVLAPAPQGST